jgi:hypothetical protein
MPVAYASRVVVVATVGTALLFAVIRSQFDEPTCYDTATTTCSDDLTVVTLAFFLGTPLLGSLVALAALGRADGLLLGVGVFLAGAVVAGFWLGGTALNEGGGYFLAAWFILAIVGLYGTAGLIWFGRVTREAARAS